MERQVKCVNKRDVNNPRSIPLNAPFYGIRKEVICLGVIYSPLTIDWEAILEGTETQFRIGSHNTLWEEYKEIVV